MAAGNLKIQKASGGVLNVTPTDGATNTSLVLPASGTVVATDVVVTDNAIARYDGTTGKVQNSAITIDDNGNIGSGTQSFNGFGGSGFKNYIINGNFDVWQRGTSQTSNGYESDDRWYNSHNFSTKTHSRVACTDTERALFNASYFSRTVVNSVSNGGGYVIKRQSIEDVTRLADKTITVSFWAKANGNKKLWIEHKQMYGAGGTPSTTLAGNNVQEFNLTNTWTKYQYTITLPSIIGKTLGTDGVHTSATELQFWFDVGAGSISRIPTGFQQSGTFDIAQVQLEEGSVATPFEQRPVGLELMLCQRYYETGYIKSWGVATAAVQSMGHTQSYKVTKRIIPSITFVNSLLANVTAIQTESGNQAETLIAYANTVASGTYAYQATFNANAEL